MQLLVYLLIASSTLANYQVFGIKSDFPQTDGQNIQRDLYINMGTSHGVKEGSQLDVFRNLSTSDDLNQRVGPNVSFRIARLRIIHAESSVSIARLVKFESPESMPNPGSFQVMVGDRVELGRR
jgi:hypothetical protein